VCPDGQLICEHALDDLLRHDEVPTTLEISPATAKVGIAQPHMARNIGCQGIDGLGLIVIKMTRP
jgi:hypothetical protein